MGHCKWWYQVNHGIMLQLDESLRLSQLDEWKDQLEEGPSQRERVGVEGDNAGVVEEACDAEEGGAGICCGEVPFWEESFKGHTYVRVLCGKKGFEVQCVSFFLQETRMGKEVEVDTSVNYFCSWCERCKVKKKKQIRERINHQWSNYHQLLLIKRRLLGHVSLFAPLNFFYFDPTVLTPHFFCIFNNPSNFTTLSRTLSLQFTLLFVPRAFHSVLEKDEESLPLSNHLKRRWWACYKKILIFYFLPYSLLIRPSISFHSPLLSSFLSLLIILCFTFLWILILSRHRWWILARTRLLHHRSLCYK